MRTHFSKFLTLFIFCLIVILTGNSCKKPSPPKGTITVLIDSSGVACPNATIRVTSYGNSKGTGNIEETLTTDDAGQATMTLKLDAVVNLYAYKLTGKPAPFDSLTATGALKLETGKENEVTLKLRY